MMIRPSTNEGEYGLSTPTTESKMIVVRLIGWIAYLPAYTKKIQHLSSSAPRWRIIHLIFLISELKKCFRTSIDLHNHSQEVSLISSGGHWTGARAGSSNTTEGCEELSLFYSLAPTYSLYYGYISSCIFVLHVTIVTVGPSIERSNSL